MLKYLLFAVIFCCTTTTLWGQSTPDTELMKQLDQIQFKDQEYRKLIFIEPYFLAKVDSLKGVYDLEPQQIKQELISLMNQSDKDNLQAIKAIIEIHGYPGKDLVTSEYQSVAWLVLQHSEDLEQYLDLLEQQAKLGQIPFSNYAYSLDRVLMGNNKAQIYGSQAKQVVFKDGEQAMIIWPIEDVKNLKKRRKQAQMKPSIKAYAKQMGIKYKPYELEDLLLE